MRNTPRTRNSRRSHGQYEGSITSKNSTKARERRQMQRRDRERAESRYERMATERKPRRGRQRSTHRHRRHLSPESCSSSSVFSESSGYDTYSDDESDDNSTLEDDQTYESRNSASFENSDSDDSDDSSCSYTDGSSVSSNYTDEITDNDSSSCESILNIPVAEMSNKMKSKNTNINPDALKFLERNFPSLALDKVENLETKSLHPDAENEMQMLVFSESAHQPEAREYAPNDAIESPLHYRACVSPSRSGVYESIRTLVQHTAMGNDTDSKKELYRNMTSVLSDDAGCTIGGFGRTKRTNNKGDALHNNKEKASNTFSLSTLIGSPNKLFACNADINDNNVPSNAIQDGYGLNLPSSSPYSNTTTSRDVYSYQEDPSSHSIMRPNNSHHVYKVDVANVSPLILDKMENQETPRYCVVEERDTAPEQVMSALTEKSEQIDNKPSYLPSDVEISDSPPSVSLNDSISVFSKASKSSLRSKFSRIVGSRKARKIRSFQSGSSVTSAKDPTKKALALAKKLPSSMKSLREKAARRRKKKRDGEDIRFCLLDDNKSFDAIDGKQAQTADPFHLPPLPSAAKRKQVLNNNLSSFSANRNGGSLYLTTSSMTSETRTGTEATVTSTSIESEESRSRRQIMQQQNGMMPAFDTDFDSAFSSGFDTYRSTK